jgi:hypothetical protein
MGSEAIAWRRRATIAAAFGGGSQKPKTNLSKMPAAKNAPANRMYILVHTSLTVSRDYEPVEGDTTPSSGNSMPGFR